MIEITPLQDRHAANADDLVAAHPHGLLYQTSRFRAFLQDVAGGTDASLAAWDDDQLVGVLPLHYRSGTLGTVVNSLPFYGSHGGILATHPDVTAALLAGYKELLENLDAAAANVSSCPFGDGPEYPATFRDERIGLMTPLPDAPQLEEELMPLLESRTRRAIRRARKAGIEIHRDSNAMDRLQALHEENMVAMGGNAKPAAFYDAWNRHLRHDEDWELHVATHPDADEPIACLLVGHHDRVAEYYMPAIQHKHRSDQPGALLILEAMKDVAVRGMTWWNWGGTWPTQTALYQFKKQWAPVETRYANHCLVRHESILDANAQALLAEYPGFFSVPYDRLRGTP